MLLATVASARAIAAPAEPASAPATAPAEDSADLTNIDLYQLKLPTVVTAGRREQTIRTVPYAVSVITAEDIRQSGARSIPDALRLAPGMDVAELSYSNAAVSPRGFPGLLSRQVLVLVDGRQIFDSVFGGTLWGSWPFQLEDIERIEVIRGPGGVTWGANAINGVINIITKDPADQQGLTVTGGGGNRGVQKEHLGYGLTDGKLRLRLSGEYEGSDGFRQGGSFLRQLDDDYKSGRQAVHGIYKAGPKDTLTFSGGSGQVDGGLPPAPAYGFRLDNPGQQANYLTTKWVHRIADDNRIEWTGYVNDFWLSAGTPVIDYRYQQLALQFMHTFKPAAAHTLTWGLDTRTDLVDANRSDPFLLSRDRVNSAIFGLYAQDEWRFADRWTLNLGGRIDYDTYGGFQPSGRAALAYEIAANSLVYGAVSRSFHMPPAALRFVDFPLLDGLAWMQSDRDLNPETVVAYELGYRTRLWDRMDLNLNAFWHQHADLATIDPRLGPPGLVLFDHDNRADAGLYGFEADASYAVTSRLKLLGHYTYQGLNWDSTAPIREREVSSPPEHKFMLGARWDPLDALHLSGYLHYIGAVGAPNPANPFMARRVDPYFRLDLRAEYEVWKDRASVAVGVRNLLDRGHYEGGTLFLNDAEVPRTVYAEVRMRFK